MRRPILFLLIALSIACESTKDRVKPDDPSGEVTIKPDEIEPMANFLLETKRLLVADCVRIEMSQQFLEQQMAYTRDPQLVKRYPVKVLKDGTRFVRLEAIHGQTSNIDPDTLPRVSFGNSGLEIRAYREIRIYMRPPTEKSRERPLFLTVDAKSDPQNSKLYVSGRMQDEKPSIVLESALIWSKDRERYIHKSGTD